MTVRWYDAMGYSAAPGPTETTGKPPSSQTLGLLPSAYFGYGYFGTTAGAVDAAKVADVGNCLPTGTQAMIDLETWVGYGALVTTNSVGSPIPSPNRTVYQSAIVQTMAGLRATSRGGSCQYAPYSSVQGAYNPDNGATWLAANLSANQTVFLEPVPGAPNGIGNLFELKMVSVYVRYKDTDLERRRIAGLADLARTLYPGQRICAAINPRFSTTYDEPARRFDYMTGEEMNRHLGYVEAAGFDDRLLWNSNLYGPEGTPASQRNSNGYAIVPGTTNTINGESWHPDAGWWQAVKSRNVIPTYQTVTVGQQGTHFTLGGHI